MARDYNPTSYKFVDKEGVHTYIKDWGGVSSFEYVDPDF